MTTTWSLLADLAELEESRLGRRYGYCAERLRAAQLEGVQVLDRRAFRLAAREVLPSGHLPEQLLAESGWRSRAIKAARAYERMSHASEQVPDPAFVRGAEEPYLLITSPALKPGALVLPELVVVKATRAERLRHDVAQLWASVFFERVLRAVPEGAARVEVAILAVPLSVLSEEQAWALLRETFSRPQDLLPLAGQAPLERPVTEFDRTLFDRSAAAFRDVIAEVAGQPPKNLHLFVGRRPGLDAGSVRYLETASSSPQMRAVVADLCGRSSSPGTVSPGFSLGNWARLATRLLGDATEQAQLSAQVQAARKRLDERWSWFQETDLAIIPDDGLRQTIETCLRQFDEVTRLAHVAARAAAESSRVYGALTGVSATELDAGLQLPSLQVLRAAAEALEVFRQDQSAVQALRGGAPLAEGPGRRALLDYARRVPEMFPPSELLSGEQVDFEHPCWTPLLQLAGRLDVPLSSVDERREQARVDADRRLARKESEGPRWAASRLSPLRARTRLAAQLREEARWLELRLDHLLRRVALDVDRRLPRLELGLPRASVWHCRLDEVIEAVDLRGRGLRARAFWRKNELEACQRLTPPYVGEDLAPVRNGRGPSAPLGEPVTLVEARQLHRLPLLLLGHREPGYQGRWTDTLPATARSLGVGL